MPRIRRWFHVSHDINSDPEVWELTDRFGERAFRVWLQILSIADTHNGVLKGTLETWSKTLLRLYSQGNPRWLRRDSERLLSALRWMSDKGWIAVREGSEPRLEVVKYWKYNPRRDTKEYPLGEHKTSPPILTSPILTSPRQDKEKDLSSDPASRPEAHPIDPQLKEWLEKTEYLKCLGNGKHGTYWKTVVAAYDAYPWLFFEEEIKLADAWCAANPSKRPTDRGMPRFFRSWLERAVDKGRKHGKA